MWCPKAHVLAEFADAGSGLPFSLEAERPFIFEHWLFLAARCYDGACQHAHLHFLSDEGFSAGFSVERALVQIGEHFLHILCADGMVCVDFVERLFYLVMDACVARVVQCRRLQCVYRFDVRSSCVGRAEVAGEALLHVGLADFIILDYNPRMRGECADARTEGVRSNSHV